MTKKYYFLLTLFYIPIYLINLGRIITYTCFGCGVVFCAAQGALTVKNHIDTNREYLNEMTSHIANTNNTINNGSANHGDFLDSCETLKNYTTNRKIDNFSQLLFITRSVLATVMIGHIIMHYYQNNSHKNLTIVLPTALSLICFHSFIRILRIVDRPFQSPCAYDCTLGLKHSAAFRGV